MGIGDGEVEDEEEESGGEELRENWGCDSGVYLLPRARSGYSVCVYCLDGRVPAMWGLHVSLRPTGHTCR